MAKPLYARPILSWRIRQMNRLGRTLKRWGQGLQDDAHELLARSVVDYRRKHGPWPLEDNHPYRYLVADERG